MTIDTKWLLVCSLLGASACVQTKLIGETTPDDSSSSGDETSESTAPPTTESSSTSASTEPADTSTSSDASGSESTGGVMGEWTGTYDSGFGNAYFTPCGETDSLFVIGDLPGYEYCAVAKDEAIWIRVAGTRVAGEFGPELHDAMLLEGPCLVGGCEPEVVFAECTEFDPLCLPTDPMCDPFTQDCPDGSKCSVQPTPELFQCVADGVVEQGEACVRTDALDDCVAGLLCAAAVLGEDGPGTCAPLCSDVSHCDGPDEACMLTDDGWGVCVPA